MHPTKDEIAHLLEAFERSEWDEMELQLGDFRLHLSSRPPSRSDGPALLTGTAAPLADPATAPAEPAAPPPPGGTGQALPPGAACVRAPSLGRFWRKSRPTEPPFVDIGSEVHVGDVVCLVEVMKLFTQVKSDVAGRVIGCPVADGTMVEFGDVLVVIEPSEG